MCSLNYVISSDNSSEESSGADILKTSSTVPMSARRTPYYLDILHRSTSLTNWSVNKSVVSQPQAPMVHSAGPYPSNHGPMSNSNSYLSTHGTMNNSNSYPSQMNSSGHQVSMVSSAGPHIHAPMGSSYVPVVHSNGSQLQAPMAILPSAPVKRPVRYKYVFTHLFLIQLHEIFFTLMLQISSANFSLLN